MFHKPTIVLYQGAWTSATKRSQYDAVLVILCSTLVIMITTFIKNKKLRILPTGFIYRLCVILRINSDYFPKQLVSHCSDPGSVPRLSMWDLWSAE
jgi:hypothetical protein